MITIGGDKTLANSYPSLSHLLISTNLIADLPAMLGYTTDESESYSDSGSGRCIMDHGDEAAGPLQGNRTVIILFISSSTAFRILCCSSFFDFSFPPSYR